MSHGEKSGELVKDFEYIGKQLADIRNFYKLNLPDLDNILNNHDNLITLINCIMSFTLRYYNNIFTDHLNDAPFQQMIIYVFRQINSQEGFLWNSTVNCIANADVQVFFDLNLFESINLSDHSAKGIVRDLGLVTTI